MLVAVLAIVYGQSEQQAPQKTLLAPKSETAVATADSLKPQSGEAASEQSRTKRAPILLGKALLGGAILGKGLIGAGALGVGALGVGALGAGLYKSAQ